MLSREQLTVSKDTILAYLTPSRPILSYFKPILSLFANLNPYNANTVTKKKHRAHTAFKTNKTASLALPDIQENHGINTSTSTIQTKLNDQCVKASMEITTVNIDPTVEKIELIAERIKEHAARRVDLFFYLLIAVYGTKTIISEEDTVKQHGMGSKKRGTQACHSALFSNIKLEMKPLTLWTRFISKKSCPSLAGTHFEETLNMTVELPSIVNKFDRHLEGVYQRSKYTNASLAILNKVANNEMTPKEGMDEFFKIMNEFFIHMENKYLKASTIENLAAYKKVWEYEKAGTFSGAHKDMKTMQESYFYAMLRLTPEQIVKVTKNPKNLEEFYKKIREEIYTSKPLEKSANNRRVRS